VEHFLRRYAEKHASAGMKVRGVSDEAMRLLCQYSWPGNIRELENTIERAMVLCESPVVEASLLEEKLREKRDPIRESLASDELSIKKTTRLVEEELIRRALASTGGNRTNAAKLLEISHRALLYKIKEYGL
jgi:two-component system response regulator AtoC